VARYLINPFKEDLRAAIDSVTATVKLSEGAG
jgi:hypothetical protein